MSAVSSPAASQPLSPALAQLLNDGYQHQMRRQFDDAVRCYRKILKQVPDQVDVLQLLGMALALSGRQEEATKEFQRITRLRPDDAKAWNNLALTYNALGRDEETFEAMERAFALDKSLPLAAPILITGRRERWNWQDLDLLMARLHASALHPTGIPANHILVQSFDEPGLLLAGARQTAHPGGRQAPAPQFSFAAQKARAGKIRIGYISADFRQHVTSVLIARLLEVHDRDRFEIYAISIGPDDHGDYRARIKAGVDHFVDYIANPTDNLAKSIAELELDVLVDLMGQTRHERLRMFAHRPAPVQATFLGYPGTTGANYMDYIIGDAVCTPFADGAFFSEKIAQLPDCYQPNDPGLPVAARPTREACGLSPDAFVFCAFNGPAKLLPATFDGWIRILQQVPNSQLWVLSHRDEAQENLRREAEARGLERERLVFAPYLDLAEHLARIPLADLFIDTYPCSAHTTASDALRMGLPMVTRAGHTFASRVAASLMGQMGLQECITHSQDAFEALAVALATDPARLADLRQRLAEARATSPLFDIDRFARHIERAYETMVTRFRAGKPPEAFAVEPQPRH